VHGVVRVISCGAKRHQVTQRTALGAVAVAIQLLDPAPAARCVVHPVTQGVEAGCIGEGVDDEFKRLITHRSQGSSQVWRTGTARGRYQREGYACGQGLTTSSAQAVELHGDVIAQQALALGGDVDLGRCGAVHRCRHRQCGVGIDGGNNGRGQG